MNTSSRDLRPFLMRVLIFFLLAIFLAGNGYSQEKTWVFFKDKGPEAPGLLVHPEKFLSPRALEKRDRMQLKINKKDLPVSVTYLKKLRDAGVVVVTQSKWLNAVSIEGALELETLQMICPEIREVEPVATLVANSIPSMEEEPSLPLKPMPAVLSTSQLNYGHARKQNSMLNISALHDQGIRGQGVVMAVFDAGFYGMDTLHAFQRMWQENRIINYWDFVDEDTLLFSESNHGMNVVSVIASDLPGELIGTAPEVTFILARTETVASETRQEEDNWVRALEWADSLGADIIHSSLGYSTFDSIPTSYSWQDLDGNTAISSKAADVGAARGLLIVSSAGNEGWGSWHKITVPCDADSVLCVGAVDSLKQYALFSSVGPSADGQIKPDVVAMGQRTAIMSKRGRVRHSNGTSFAAPLVAGIAACLVQAHPNRTNMEVIHAIRESADRYSTPDTAYGHGIPDALKADSILSELDSIDIADHPERYEIEHHFRIFAVGGGEMLHIHHLSSQYSASRVEIRSERGTESAISAGRSGVSVDKLDIQSLPAGKYSIEIELFSGEKFTREFEKR